MNISNFFIKRPIFAAVISIIILSLERWPIFAFL